MELRPSTANNTKLTERLSRQPGEIKHFVPPGIVLDNSTLAKYVVVGGKRMIKALMGAIR